MVLAVNAYSMNGGSSAGTSQTLSITTTVVNTVLVLLCWNQSYGITSITDGTLPTWQRRFRQPDGTSGYVEEWWTVAAAILTAHSQVDYRRVVRLSRLVFDARNAAKGIRSPKVIRL